MVRLTQSIFDLADYSGACEELHDYTIGMDVMLIEASHIEWFIDRYGTPDDLAHVPGWAIGSCGYGDGDGAGYGAGDGYGAGYSAGDGYGYGCGYGDGYGNGYGDGSGDGYGDGYGDGSGYGGGYGDGHGYLYCGEDVGGDGGYK